MMQTFNLDALKKTVGPFPFEYQFKQTALYALACGAQENDLDLLLETRGPKVLPTFIVVPAFQALFSALSQLGGNILKVVHSGQTCTLHKPLSSEATLQTTCTPIALYDLGKNALAIFQTETFEVKPGERFSSTEPMVSTDRVATTEWQIFYRDQGGFGGEKAPKPEERILPAQDSSFAESRMTDKTQALLYRIASGDLNPIHSDPKIAEQAGLGKPILHGLCTYGHAAMAAVHQLCKGDPDRLTHIEARFSKPVYPGDTLKTVFHKKSVAEAWFETYAGDNAVITGGRVLIREK